VNPNIVILAGGMSSRMKKTAGPVPGVDGEMLRQVKEKAKAMLPVGEGSRPFLDYSLYNIERAGYSDVVIVTAERDGSIRSHYEAGGHSADFPGLRFSYVTQVIPAGREKPAGTADALLTALRSRPDWRGRRFTVCNSDNIYSVRVLRMLLDEAHPNAMVEYDRDALGFPPERTAHFSVVRCDERGFLTEILEKPSAAEIDAALGERGRVGVSMNIFRLSYDDILPVLESTPLHPVRNEKELPTAVNMLAASRPGSVLALPVSETVPDLTSLADIAEVRNHLGSTFPPGL
jgi:glucose-1-phosphate adenylyltransferase